MGYVLKILCLFLLILADGFLAASENNNSLDALERFAKRKSISKTPVKKDVMPLSDDSSDRQSTSSGDSLDELVARMSKKPKLDVGQKWLSRLSAPTTSLSISSNKDKSTARLAKLRGIQELLIALAMRDITNDKTSRRHAIKVTNNRK